MTLCSIDVDCSQLQHKIERTPNGKMVPMLTRLVNMGAFVALCSTSRPVNLTINALRELRGDVRYFVSGVNYQIG